MLLQNQPFPDQLRQVLDAAVQARLGGAASEETVVLIGHQGDVRIVQHSDWTLESLAAHHGAARAYHITGGKDEVHVHARAGANISRQKRFCPRQTAVNV